MAMMKIDCEVLSTSNLNVAPPAPKHEKNDTAEDYEGDLYKVQPNDQFPLKGREEKGKKGHFYPLKGREERISKDFNSEAAYDQFESVYKEGHLEDVVQFPHHLHPKNINKISKAKSVTNKTSAAKGNDLQNDYKKWLQKIFAGFPKASLSLIKLLLLLKQMICKMITKNDYKIITKKWLQKMITKNIRRISKGKSVTNKTSAVNDLQNEK